MKKSYIAITLCSLLMASSTLLADEKKSNKLDTITIIGQDDSSYLDYDKPSITRGNINLEDTSRSVQVFNDKFIENYQAKDVAELPSLSSNVTFSGDNRSRGVNYKIRGFNNDTLLRDGLAVPKAIPSTEVYNLDRIEVLKGPDSIQFGQADPGGLINLVKKKPLKEEHAEIVLDVNDNIAITPKVDFGGMIGDQLSYRVVASYTNDETYKEFKNDLKRYFIAPTLTYDINDNNSIDFILEINNEDKPYDFGGISYRHKGELMHDRKYPISNPDELATREQTTYGFDYRNTFGNFESNFRYRHIEYEFDLPIGFYPVQNSIDYVNKTLTGAVSDYYTKNKSDIFQYTLTHKYEDDTFKNSFNFGLDYTKDKFTHDTGWEGRTPVTTQNYDLKNGNYPKLPSSVPAGLIPFTEDGTDITKSKGIFIQNSLTINDNFIVNTGLRYDKVDFDSRDGIDTDFNEDNLTPQLGFVYKINPESSVYANYSESFHTQTTRDINGKVLAPETGKGFELGLRQSLFDDYLHLTTSIFKIEKENVAINHGVHPNNDYRASGKVQSKGFEIDLGGNITDDFAILASYGYVKTKDDEGDKFTNVAQHTGNIYGTYRINDFYLSGGLQYVGSRYAKDRTYGFVKFDSHLVSNVNIAYKKEDWSINVGVKNLTDEIYFSSVGTNAGASNIGTPRTIYGSISYRF